MQSWKYSISRLFMLIGGVICGMGILGLMGAIKQFDNALGAVISGAVILLASWFFSIMYGSPKTSNQ